MPSVKQNSRPGGANPTSARKQKKQNGPQRSRAAKVYTRMNAYARMLTDPCDATLVPGMYGSEEGYLARFHRAVTLPDLSAGSATCALCLWVPDFHNQGQATTSVTRYNLLTWVGATTSQAVDLSGILASTSFPEFTSYAVPDPAYDFVAGTVCSDARMLSACIKLSYLGAVSTARGLIGHLDLPWTAFEDAVSGSGVTIDQLFQLSQSVQRTAMEPLEIKATPPLSEPPFKSHAPYGATSGADGDYGIQYQPPGTFTIGASAQVLNPRVIGFVFRGFDEDAGGKLSSQFVIDCYKNIEWRPQAKSGLTVPEPRRVSGGNVSHQVVAMLDAAMPGWKTRAHSMMRSGAQGLAYKALAYSGELFRRNAPKVAGLLMG